MSFDAVALGDTAWIIEKRKNEILLLDACEIYAQKPYYDSLETSLCLEHRFHAQPGSMKD